MATKVRPPFSTAVVEVDDEVVERYEKAGWVKVEKPKPARPAKNDK
jgi:hypothetical protein